MRHLYSASAIALLALAGSATAVYAQETTSSVRGSVTGDGQALADAMVTVTHVPSGTSSTTKTGAEGAFSLPGLRPGGPYTVVVKASGFPDAKFEGINLVVGTPFNLPVALDTTVGELVVTGKKPPEGLATSYSRGRIEGVPSVNRDLRDVIRQDPYASINPTSRGVSIAGTRNTTNLFSVDGVRFSDNFGLQGGGLPTNRGPVSVDAVEQLSVKIAPYDVTEGNFQGGSINVVLRSGGNDFKGSAFYAYNDDSLTGKKVFGTSTSLSLTSKQYGGFLSGPILKDKLFFALSYEKLDAVVPANFGLAGAPNVVPGLTDAIVANVTGIAKTTYGYDTLGIATTQPESDQKYSAKLDFNINDMHRASYTYIHDDGETEAIGGGSTNATNPTIGYQAYATHEPQQFNSHVLQLNSTWNSAFSSEIRLNARKALQIPLSYGGGGGAPGRAGGFSQFSVCADPVSTGNTQACSTGVPRLFFGVEQFSQADVVGQSQYGADIIGRLNVGNHLIKAQFNYSHLKIENVFVQSSLGVYYFDSTADLTAKKANSLTYQYSITGDLKDVFAGFTYEQYNFGLQDSWDITPKLNLLYGIRGDLYQMTDQSPLNKNFVNRYGFANNFNLNGNLVWEPRLALTYRATPDLTLRAGVGLFNGGTPDVYIGNSFSVAGVYGNTITIQRDPTSATGCTSASIPSTVPLAQAQAICAAALNNVSGSTIDPLVKSFLQTNTAALTAAPVNALDKDFKVAQTWKFTLSADYRADLSKYKLGDSWRFGGDLYYGKVKEAAYYTDLRLTKVGNAPDGRPIYADTYTSSNNFDLVEKNDGMGHSLVTVIRASKAFDFGLLAGISYTYSDVTSYADMGGSTANGTYGSQQSTDPNKPTYGTSDYQVRNDTKVNLDYEHNWFGDNATRISLYGELRSGLPYSLTMNTVSTRAVFGVTGTTSRFLLYVPDVSSFSADPRVTYDSVTTYNNLKAYVEALGLPQGQIVEKNSRHAPDYFKVDLHLEQEVPVYTKYGVKLRPYVDIENLLNLINQKWGSYRTVSNLSPIVNVACNAGCTKYTYSAFSKPAVVNNVRQGLWAARVGLKVEF